MLSKLFSETNTLKVLVFLAMHSGKQYFEKEIARHLGLNQSSVHVVLKELEKEEFIHKETKGKMNFYTLDDRYYQIREIKVLAILMYIEKLITKLIPVADKIILFGSCANGTYREDSDIDLFIETDKEKEAMKIVSNFITETKEEKKIQTIISSTKELLRNRDAIITKEIKKGRILYEREINEPVF